MSAAAARRAYTQTLRYRRVHCLRAAEPSSSPLLPSGSLWGGWSVREPGSPWFGGAYAGAPVRPCSSSNIRSGDDRSLSARADDDESQASEVEVREADTASVSSTGSTDLRRLVAATLLAQEEKVSRRVLPQRCPRPTPKRKARMLRVHVFLPAVFAC